MAYILAVNPQVLSLAGVKGVSGDMKMDQGAIFVATVLAAFVGSLFMGLIAKYPQHLRQEWDLTRSLLLQ